MKDYIGLVVLLIPFILLSIHFYQTTTPFGVPEGFSPSPFPESVPLSEYHIGMDSPDPTREMAQGRARLPDYLQGVPDVDVNTFGPSAPATFQHSVEGFAQRGEDDNEKKPESLGTLEGFESKMIQGAKDVASGAAHTQKKAPAQAVADIQGGQVAGIKMLDSGSGYDDTASIMVKIEGDCKHPAQAVPHVAGGQVHSIQVVYGGEGYNNTPRIVITQS